MKTSLLASFFIFLLFSLTGCQKESYSIRTVPKDSASELSLSVSQSPLSWTAPKDWIEGPASGMRLGSFILNSDSGRADVTLISLPARSGSLSANVVRWAKQVGRLDVDELGAKGFMANRRFGEHDGYVIDVAGSETRIVAVIFVMGETRYFVKLMGPDVLLKSHIDVFFNFVSSIRFRGHEH
jgi:hypothetical protein